MNVDAELDRMKQAIFTEDLLTKLLSCSQKTLDAQGSTVPPEEAQAARAALEDLLTPQQKQILAALEEKHRDILRRLLPFAVQQGLCTGFQQYFSNEPLTTPLPGLVTQKVLDQTVHCTGYTWACQQATDLFDTVYDQLPDQTAQDQWTDLDLVWEDREYILALDAFHLGYRAALRILGNCFGLDASISMLPQVLLTEHDLGVLMTSQEQERRPACRPAPSPRTLKPLSLTKHKPPPKASAFSGGFVSVLKWSPPPGSGRRGGPGRRAPGGSSRWCSRRSGSTRCHR